MIKKIVWFVNNVIGIVIGKILNIFLKRDCHYIIFSARTGTDRKELFLNNTKYLFLYLNTLKTDFHINWLCEDEQMVKIFHKYGYVNIYSRKSLKGIYYSLKSKYWFYDFTTSDLPRNYIHDACLINLWHATGGLKKAVRDSSKIKKYSIQDKIRNFVQCKDSFFNVDSDNQRKIRLSEFDTSNDKIITLGSPRIDVLYHEFKDENMFIENDYKNIKSFKEQGRKLFFYTPTWRDTRENVSGWLKSEKLKEFLQINNAVFICKLHPFDVNSLDFDLGNEIYKMNSASDIYPVLKFSDAMIADYSSIYFDYLNLDKPVIHFVPDLEEFQEQCRGFYDPYETTAVGEIAKNEDELLNAMQDVLNGVDNHCDKRKKMRDELFTYQDGKNCERVVEFIRNLNKQCR